MRRAVLRLTWWAMVGCIVGSLTLTFALNRSYGPDDFLAIPFLGYALVGAMVVYRRPDNAIGWVFLSAGALFSVGSLGSVGVEKVLAQGPPVPAWGGWVVWYDHVFWFPIFMMATAFTFLLYPEGLPSPRWRPVLWTAVVGTVTGTLVLAITPLLDVDQRGVRPGAFLVDNPLSPPFLSDSMNLRSSWWWYVPVAISLACVVASIVGAVMRFRRSTGIEHQQMRLFAVAIVLLPLCVPTTVTFAAALTVVPVACGVAVLRYHLYDIDRIVSRSTSYVLVTAVLLVVYGVVVSMLSLAIPHSSNLAVTMATLSAAALFRPVLGWARGLVNRHFNREQYDAQLAVEDFARRVRDQVDPERVEGELLTVVQGTIQPRAVRLDLTAQREGFAWPVHTRADSRSR
jgi:hypothetical protein